MKWTALQLAGRKWLEKHCFRVFHLIKKSKCNVLEWAISHLTWTPLSLYFTYCRRRKRAELHACKSDIWDDAYCTVRSLCCHILRMNCHQAINAISFVKILFDFTVYQHREKTLALQRAKVHANHSGTSFMASRHTSALVRTKNSTTNPHYVNETILWLEKSCLMDLRLYSVC